MREMIEIRKKEKKYRDQIIKKKRKGGKLESAKNKTRGISFKKKTRGIRK